MASTPQALRLYGLAGKEFAQRLRDHNITAPSGHYDLNRFASASVDDLNRYVERCIEGAQAARSELHHVAPLDEDSRTDRALQGRRRTPESAWATWRSRPDCRSPTTTTTSSSSTTTASGLRHHPVGNRRRARQTADRSLLARSRLEAPAPLLVQAPARPLRDVARQGHAQGQPRLHRARERQHRLHAIWPDTELAGMKHFFVEQGGNFAHDPMQSVADCAEYVKRFLLK